MDPAHLAAAGEAVMDAVARYALNGLASGAVIALMALGVVVLYRSTHLLNFAQGTIASLGAYFFFQLYAPSRWSLPALPALLGALAATAAAGAAVWAVAVHPLRRADSLTRTVATLGVVLVGQVLMRVVWGGTEEFLPPLLEGRVGLGRQAIGAQALLIVVVTAAVTVGLGIWFRRSFTGLALAASADDPTSARLCGVAPERVSLVAWVLASLLGGLAGILVTPLLVLNPIQMTLIMVTSYGAALFGGFTSLPLAAAGGVVIGVAQSIATAAAPVAGLSETTGFLAVFAILLVTRGRRIDLTALLRREEAAL